MWGWQFDNKTDYGKGLDHLLHFTGFYDGTAGPNCPPKGSSTIGSGTWNSTSDPRFKAGTGQVFDCYVDHLSASSGGNQATYLWSFPQYNIILLAQNATKDGGYPPLDTWWTALSYG